MHLTYRGQAHHRYAPTVATTELPETATFLGRSYHRNQQSVGQPSSPPEELQFMGQRYRRVENGQPLPCKPRPGERMVNSRQLLQLRRSRLNGRRHPAFRGS